MLKMASGNLNGLGALLLWATMIGLMRSVTEAFGVAAGTALIYTIASLVLLLKNGVPKVKQMPKAYLFGAGTLFVTYEIVFSRAIGMAQNTQQTLEIGMLNYLWPCLTVIFSIWINKTKLRWPVWPGTALAILGLYWCVAANNGLNFPALVKNLLSTPLPYILGTTAGISWALYSNMSVRFSNGYNAVEVFLTVIAIILWGAFFMSGASLHFPGYWALAQLVLLGSVFGLSYSMWETGIHHGNFMLLAVCSYFSPASSMLFASLWLNILPPMSYWLGVLMVIAGSMLCWAASIKRAIPSV